MPDPFWICHECHSEMRPIYTNNIPHCASCNGEFIEILDPEINPDPYHELPPPPPARPGQGPAPPRGEFPPFLFNYPPPPHHTTRDDDDPPSPTLPEHSDNPPTPGSFLSNLFGLLSTGNRGNNPGDNGGQPSRPPPLFADQLPRDNQGGEGSNGDQGGRGGPRTYSFNLGNTHTSVTVGSFNLRGNVGGQGAPQNPVAAFGGLDDPDPFAADPPGAGNRPRNDPNMTDEERLQQEARQVLQTITAVLSGEGGAAFVFPGGGNLGDYAGSDGEFQDILDRFMDAAGPQGSVPANDTVIEGLPRFTFDEKSLSQSQFKDCPVCKDDFQVDDAVVRIPCQHTFHDDCLVPWLKQNGTCPVWQVSVLRFSLVSEEDREAHRRRNNPLNQPFGGLNQGQDGNAGNRQGQQGQNLPGGMPGILGGLFRNIFGLGDEINLGSGRGANEGTGHDAPRSPGPDVSARDSHPHPAYDDQHTASESSDDDSPIRVFAENPPASTSQSSAHNDSLNLGNPIPSSGATTPGDTAQSRNRDEDAQRVQAFDRLQERVARDYMTQRERREREERERDHNYNG
ncbi:hypothetical protein I350_04082 [Cryptococcus amylolentus CBS 6273]|uniref:RING-type domain-containing protein n=1 Tax=Cryptococcus amylolentus CBS 6273 TaxID=1296118 RepID=A0A1E3K143_9TREE|nr:hypothetical protein I350_04082 [Cryptococcus amylolentus CBS 6273]